MMISLGLVDDVRLNLIIWVRLGGSGRRESSLIRGGGISNGRHDGKVQGMVRCGHWKTYRSAASRLARTTSMSLRIWST